MRHFQFKTRMRDFAFIVIGGAGFGLTGASSNAGACTGFAFETPEGPIVGKSYDWDDGAGYVMFNKKGVAKKALLLDHATPAVWTSSHASLTFNQLGRELPLGGMNDFGLTVEIMWLNETVYPPATEPKPAVNESQWIQYQLDNSATVEDAVASAESLRISAVAAKVHYLVCDAKAACATFEYLKGELVVHAGDQLSAHVLTNDTATRSLDYLSRYDGFGGSRAIPQDSSSLSRFVRAAAISRANQSGDPVSYGFSILDSVRAGTFSKWNIIYDVAQRLVHFKTLDAPALKTVRFDAFDESCSTPVLVFDMNTSAVAGDVTDRFIPYDPAISRWLITRASANLPSPLPQEALDFVATYPERGTNCTVH